MATDHNVSFRKIDTTKLSFSDLPGEVREKIYQEYFLLLGDFAIHLTNVAPDRVPGTDPANLSEPSCTSYFVNRKAVFSTDYLHHLESRSQRSGPQSHHEGDDATIEDLSAKTAILDLNIVTVEDVMETTSQQNVMWTHLEAAAKALQTEARRYSYATNNFFVLNGEDKYSTPYHNDLDIVPQRLLARIKNLEICDMLLGAAFSVACAGRSTGPWPILLTKMMSLQSLCISCTSAESICEILKIFTMSQACYIGKRPEIFVEVEVMSEPIGYSQEVFDHAEVSELAPRFIVPPLKTITLRGWTDPVLCSGADGMVFDTVDWSGSQLKLVNVSMGRFGLWVRTYELIWQRV